MRAWKDKTIDGQFNTSLMITCKFLIESIPVGFDKPKIDLCQSSREVTFEFGVFGFEYSGLFDSLSGATVIWKKWDTDDTDICNTAFIA